MELFYKDQNNQYKELADIDGQIKFKAFGMIPTQFQETLKTQDTIQQITASLFTANTWQQGSWIDVTGYENLVATSLNDAAVSMSVGIDFSHDKATVISTGNTTVTTTTFGEYSVPVKARYARVTVKNGDATNPHTISAWLYRKS